MKAQAPAPLPVKGKRASVSVTSVPQETFAEPAAALAAKLGWDGPDHFVGNDISVRDAKRFLQKTLHEQHQAAALGAPALDFAAVCEHLGLTAAADLEAVQGACALAYESGKGQATTQVEKKNVSLDARAEGSASAALGRMAAAVAKK